MGASIVLLRLHQPQLFESQTERVVALLLSQKGQWVASPEIAKVGGLQYASRIFSARKKGYTILNRTNRVKDQVHGAYMLNACPGETPFMFLEVVR